MLNFVRKNTRKLFLILLSFVFLTIGCAKAPVPGPSYDTVNRIFRVHVTPKENTPYILTIKQTDSALATPSSFDIFQMQQNTGSPVNYGFTPNIGRLINVKIESPTNDLKALEFYAYYKGAHTWKIDLKASPEGGVSGEFSYFIED